MEEMISFNEELSNPGFVFPVVDVKTFVEYLLPPLKAGIDLNLVKSTLKKGGSIDSRGRWKELWSVPEGSRRKRYDTFAPLLDIFEKATSVASAKTPHLEQVLEMVLIPEKVKERDWKNKSSQIACFSFRSGQSRKVCGREASWLNIALTASFNRTANDASRKQVSTFQQVHYCTWLSDASEFQKDRFQHPTCNGPGSKQEILVRDHGREYDDAAVVLFACFASRKHTL